MNPEEAEPEVRKVSSMEETKFEGQVSAVYIHTINTKVLNYCKVYNIPPPLYPGSTHAAGSISDSGLYLAHGVAWWWKYAQGGG